MIRDEEFSSGLNNKATFLGFTALHYAALTNNLGIIKLLIKYGANPNLENEMGHKPVMYTNSEEIKKYLTAQMERVRIMFMHYIVTFLLIKLNLVFYSLRSYNGRKRLKNGGDIHWKRD